MLFDDRIETDSTSDPGLRVFDSESSSIAGYLSNAISYRF